MFEVTGAMSFTRNNSQFCLGGGTLKRSSFGLTQKCSVTSVFLEMLGNENYNNTFQWPTILKKYKEQIGLKDCNIYTFCAKHWSKNKDRPPQFIVFHDRPSWPLTEDYSKWILPSYKPWSKSTEEIKHSDGTYKSTLEEDMYNDLFPKRILALISHVKRNKQALVLDESPLYQEQVGTPTSDREDEQFDCAVNAVILPPSKKN